MPVKPGSFRFSAGLDGALVLKVLIVEDDLLIADLLEANLVAAGYAVCGIACTVAEAVDLAERYDPDLAVVDFYLRDSDNGTVVAAALRRRGKFGVLYATASHADPLMSRAEGEGCLAKPYTTAALLAALDIVWEIACGRPAPSTLPRRFWLLDANLRFPDEPAFVPVS